MQSKKKRISEGPDMHDDILSLKKTSQIYDIWGLGAHMERRCGGPARWLP